MKIKEDGDASDDGDSHDEQSHDHEDSHSSHDHSSHSHSSHDKGSGTIEDGSNASDDGARDHVEFQEGGEIDLKLKIQDISNREYCNTNITNLLTPHEPPNKSSLLP